MNMMTPKLKIYVLVCCKDRYILYCLTNSTATNESGSSFCRIQGGLIQISRPRVIGDYNDNMGVSYIAGIMRLRCKSSNMGLHGWLLKLMFF